MNPSLYDGPAGLARMKAHMRAAFAEWPERAAGARAQNYFRGWLHGLADGQAANESELMAAGQFVNERGYERPAADTIDLYNYPDDSFRRVEGKGRAALEAELEAGGPYPDGRVGRIYAVAGDATHPLHYVAKHYLFLSRAALASRDVQELAR